MNLFEKPHGVQTRWFSFENQSVMQGRAGLENEGAKGHAFDHVKAGETKTLLDVDGSGTICRIWLTIDDRSPEMLRSLRLDMFWDGADKPAVSVPLGDFFGVGLGRKVAFECALFSDPEGRSFNCCVPMPFRMAAKVTITNESSRDLVHLFYDIDSLMGVKHSAETLYFHAHWRRESPNPLGYDFDILPQIAGNGRFLGCNVGVIANPDYEGAWWGEGEVKVRFGGDDNATLCGSGTEDYIGTGWGQGFFAQRTQGCLVADKDAGHWCLYRYHIDDPIYFDVGCRISIQTIGGNATQKVLALKERGVSLIPVSVDTGEAGGFIQLFDGLPHDLQSPDLAEKWCNFWRQDDWSATAYYYLDSPQGCFSGIQPASLRVRAAEWELDRHPERGRSR
jgi:hypothetical protein